MNSGVSIISSNSALASCFIIAFIYILGLYIFTWSGPLLQPTLLQIHPNYFQLIQDFIIWYPRWLIIRNFIISPITEEIVFRASFIAILNSASFGKVNSVLIAAAIFSISHLHHVIEMTIFDANQFEIVQSSMDALFQMTYTFLFGLYAGFFFISNNRSLLCCVVVHALCNFIGPPPIFEVLSLTAEKVGMEKKSFRNRRVILSIVYLIGLFAFLFLWFHSCN